LVESLCEHYLLLSCRMAARLLRLAGAEHYQRSINVMRHAVARPGNLL
jgi:hypothetical protein